VLGGAPWDYLIRKKQSGQDHLQVRRRGGFRLNPQVQTPCLSKGYSLSFLGCHFSDLHEMTCVSFFLALEIKSRHSVLGAGDTNASLYTGGRGRPEKFLMGLDGGLGGLIYGPCPEPLHPHLARDWPGPLLALHSGVPDGQFKGQLFRLVVTYRLPEGEAQAS
jgi:hypothetical protein